MTPQRPHAMSDQKPTPSVVLPLATSTPDEALAILATIERVHHVSEHVLLSPQVYQWMVDQLRTALKEKRNA